MDIPSSDDFYDILGVDKDATNEQIEKNYRALCRKHHPDLNKDNKERAQKYTMKLNEAYETLKDKDLRLKYDISKGYKNSFESIHNIFDFDTDIFSQKESVSSYDLNIHLSTDVDLVSAFLGSTKSLKYSKRVNCETCKGIGSEQTKNKCKKCNGSGTMANNSIFGLAIFKLACNKCKGTGRDLLFCNRCKGSGGSNKSETISFNVPKGIRSNEKIKIRGLGNQVMNQTGDLIVSIVLRHHDIFYFDNTGALFVDHIVSLKDALLRKPITIETLDGVMTVNLPEKLSSNTILNIKNAGYWNKNQRDVLKVKLFIEIPIFKDSGKLSDINF